MNTESNETKIALALSGGGIRAMVFHLGVLRLLAERSQLEKIARISTVSGGSLIIGLILKENKMQWPTSSEFLSEIYPALRNKLCSRSLQWGAARQLFNPLNWRFLLARANLLGLALKNEWNIQCELADLPLVPEWSINGTTAENGKRFRFKRENLGDYTLGYATTDNFHLSTAMAVSAAFPVGFGPLVIKAKNFTWKKREWNAPIGSEEPNILPYKKLHLYDGGVYDNLGLEPFFDAGTGLSKHENSILIVSDAGAPLPEGFSFLRLSPGRVKRIADIMSDQSHALRVRTFINYLKKNPNSGAFIFIKPKMKTPSDDTQFASSFPTTLRKLSSDAFDRIAKHGYEVAFNEM